MRRRTLILLILSLFLEANEANYGNPPPPTFSPNSSFTCNFSADYRTKDNHYTGDISSTCLPGYENGECITWRMNSVILLTDHETADDNLDDIIDFVLNTTRTCATNSEIQIFLPCESGLQTDCTIYRFATTAVRKTLTSINTSMVYPRGTTSPGDTLFYLLESVLGCLTSHPLTTSDGAVLDVFTDISCEDVCDSEKLRSTLPDILQASVTSGFVVRFILFNNSAITCMSHMMNSCAVGEDHSFCEIVGSDGVHDYNQNICIDSKGSSAMHDTFNGSTTQKPGNNNPFTTTDVVLIIVLPCICVTLCFVVCCTFCYKCSMEKMKQMRELVMHNNPDSKDWKARKLGKPKKDSFSTLNEIDCPVAGFAEANNYMDIRAMAIANKKDVWEIDPKNMIVHEGEILGKGAFANVYKGTLLGKVPLFVVNASLNLALERENDGHCEMAVKKLPAHADEQNHLDFFHEIAFMKKLGYHAHVISMLGCVSNPFEPLIIIEYCSRGDLLKFLRRHRDLVLMKEEDVCPVDADMCLRIKDLVSIAWQVADGMSYLSSRNFIHRDLAARNILLTKNMTAKISDFGLCRYIDSALYTTKGGRLPIKWMALESLKLYEFSVKSDVWAFSVMLFELFSMGDVPYPTTQPTDMIDYLESGQRLHQPLKCPNELFKIMQKCWKAEPENRPNFNELRGELTILLNLDDESYGYISLEESKRISSKWQMPDENPPVVQKTPEASPRELRQLSREHCPSFDGDSLLETLHNESKQQDDKACAELVCDKLEETLEEHVGPEVTAQLKEIFFTKYPNGPFT